MTTPSSAGRRPADWFDEIVEPIEKFVEASAGEARSIGMGLRRALTGERVEQAFSAIRQRLRRERGLAADEMCEAELDSISLREQVRTIGLENTIEHWPLHSIAPPSIRL